MKYACMVLHDILEYYDSTEYETLWGGDIRDYTITDEYNSSFTEYMADRGYETRKVHANEVQIVLFDTLRQGSLPQKNVPIGCFVKKEPILVMKSHSDQKEFLEKIFGKGKVAYRNSSKSKQAPLWSVNFDETVDRSSINVHLQQFDPNDPYPQTIFPPKRKDIPYSSSFLDECIIVPK